MPKNNPEMTASAVVEIVELLNQNGIGFHIDGGWGVDALLGEQTRAHADLDIAMQHKDVVRLRALLTKNTRGAIPNDGLLKRLSHLTSLYVQ